MSYRSAGFRLESETTSGSDFPRTGIYGRQHSTGIGCIIPAAQAFQFLDRSRTKQNTPPAEHCVATTKSHKGTSMKLHRNQYCPIHHSRVCCGREKAPKARHLTMGVERINDPNHPRGYRELRSPAELRKVLTQKISEQQGNCGICHLPFTDCKDIVPDHIEPKGMGAARRDDHPDNIQAAHRLCNLLKGSRRLSHHQSSE